MSKKTEETLKNWENGENDISDDIHHHFNDFGRWNWCDIYREGSRVWNLMFPDEPISEDSAVEAIFSGIAAQAEAGAFAQVAAALGVDAEALRMTASEWGEDQDNLPPPVGPEKFMERISEDKEWLRKLAAGELDEVGE